MQIDCALSNYLTQRQPAQIWKNAAPGISKLLARKNQDLALGCRKSNRTHRLPIQISHSLIERNGPAGLSRLIDKHDSALKVAPENTRVEITVPERVS
jgi:hypothetical protein